MPSRPISLRALAALCLMSSAASAVEIVAHRGASFDAPENTLASEKLAWRDGADVVENDIHLTKDGKIIVCHDKTTQRTTGHPGTITAMTFAELRTLDAGKWKGEQFAGEKLPTLDEQIALIPAGKRMFVEIKVGPEILPELERTLQRAGGSEKNITFISFVYASLQEVRKRLPAYKTQYLVGYKKADGKKTEGKPQPTLDEVIAQAKTAGLTGLDLQSTWPLTAAETKQIQDAGLELHVWTVDDPAVAKHWIELGAISITTNRSGWLREQLKL
ncbi:MAG: glycerophosphodiester phosphodiesterase [Verrucomicrobiota bacterium]|jgi:glycerophosphoryl diester phosphodiesterase